MVFLSPLFLLGLFAALIPIAIHLIRKEKPPKLMFSTIRFLKKTSKKLVLFQQIQQWLLLLLRAALIALLVFAFARPLFNQSVSRLLDTEPQSVVILLDASMSMAYGERFDNAKDAVLDLLDALSPGDEAALVVFAAGVQSLQELTTDTDSLRSTVQNLGQPGFGVTRFLPNLRLADQMLAASRYENREIFLVSDFQQTGLTDAEAGFKLAPGVRFNGIDVGDDASSNLVLTDVRSPEQLLEGVEQQSILARVRSTGAVHLQQAEVTLSVDGSLVDRRQADLTNTSEAVVTLTAGFDSSGTRVGQVTVNGDNFSVDNSFYFTVDVSPRISVLLINGDASDNWYDDEGHWFNLALSSSDQAAFTVQSTEPSSFTPSMLAGTDVVALLNVGDLSGGQAQALERFTLDGGSLFIAPGDRVNPQQFNQQFGNISPAILGTSNQEQLDDYLVIADLDRRHPIFRSLTNEWSARFQRHWTMEPDSQATVLMRFDNTDPALVERDAGQGKVLLFASTMDLAWNNLPLQGMFLPFVHESLRHLVEPPAKERAYQVGQVINLQIEDASASVSAVGPDGAALQVENGVVTVNMPGIVRARVDGEEQFFAVNVLAEESNLLRTPVATIHDDIINPDTNPIPSRQVRTAQLIAELEQPQRVWWWIIGLVMALLLVEARIANRTYR
ncbi:MAG: BatA domain-containing protein [Pseudohongiellaceae bacterium]